MLMCLQLLRKLTWLSRDLVNYSFQCYLVMLDGDAGDTLTLAEQCWNAI